MTSSLQEINITSIAGRVEKLLFGERPNNTVFNYNWLPVRMISRSLKKVCAELSRKSVDVVDMGAGASPYYSIFEPVARTYTAVDFQGALPENEQRPISQIEAPAWETGLADESTDLIVATQLFAYAYEHKLIFRECSRILSAKGKVLATIPHVSPILNYPYDTYRYTPYALKRLADEYGFKIISIEHHGDIFSSFALCFAMSLVLERYSYDSDLKLIHWRRFLFAPLIAIINLCCLAADNVFRFNRTPLNLFLVMEKEKAVTHE